MGPMKLHFDIRDIFRAPRLALSGKKIMIMLAGLLTGYSFYWVLTTISLMLSGYSFEDIWTDFGLYPCLLGVPESSSLLACIIFDVGAFILLISISLACTAVSRVTYKQLKGDEFYSSADSCKFVKNHWTSVLMAPISIAFIITFFLIFAGLFALIGKIPYVGEFLFSIPFLFYFLGSLFTIYTGIVFFTSVLYGPVIVGVGEEDTMGTVFQSYSITWSQPWRILLYHVVLLPILAIGIFVFKWFMNASFSLVNYVFGCEWFMGEKLHKIVSYAYEKVYPEFINTICGTLCCITSCISKCCCICLSFTPYNDGGNLTGTETASAFILGIFIFMVVLSVVSYGLSVLSVGETIMYLIFKKKSDNDNLLERKDEDDLDEDESQELGLNDEPYEDSIESEKDKSDESNLEFDNDEESPNTDNESN